MLSSALLDSRLTARVASRGLHRRLQGALNAVGALAVGAVALWGTAGVATPLEALSIVFVPADVTDPGVVIDYSVASTASGMRRRADVTLAGDGTPHRSIVEDEAAGRPTGREILPTPHGARAKIVDGAWLISLQDVGEWQGERPTSGRARTSHDGPAVVVTTSARLALDGTLLDLPLTSGAHKVVDATLYGTWRSVKGQAFVRRGPAHDTAIVLVDDAKARLVGPVGQEPQDQEPPFVVDTRNECARTLPAAGVLGWRVADRTRAQRAQVFAPGMWACGQDNDVGRLVGETREGSRRIPIHGIWVRAH